MLWKNKDIANVVTHNNLDNILSKKWPVKIGFKLALVVKTLKDYFDVYESQRLKIIERYAKKRDDGTVESDKDGRVIFCNRNDMNSCTTELAELDNLEYDIPTEIIIIRESDIPEELSPMDFIALLKIISIEEDADG